MKSTVVCQLEREHTQACGALLALVYSHKLDLVNRYSAGLLQLKSLVWDNLGLAILHTLYYGQLSQQIGRTAVLQPITPKAELVHSQLFQSRVLANG